MIEISKQSLKRLAAEHDQEIWAATALLSAAAAGVGARASLKARWRALKKNEPPLDPTLPDTTWTDAIAWSVAVGVGMGLARLLARRSAAAAWRHRFGSLPHD